MSELASSLLTAAIGALVWATNWSISQENANAGLQTQALMSAMASWVGVGFFIGGLLWAPIAWWRDRH